MIFGPEWMLILLRKSETTFNKISLNALGCLGSVVTFNQNDFDIINNKSMEEIMDSIFFKK